ncbi:MAG: class I SAM-dependent methyltransferase [Candidatus Bathyarchaeota archaeon]|nr:class I SAM-dependent methyltransferase [Candidatus Bathyarchaeota archaeon]
MPDLVRFLSEWLAVQAVPRLAREIGLPLNLPEERMIYGLSTEEIQRILGEYDDVLAELVRRHNISWWDVYTSSDVGKERLVLASEMRLYEDDVVLDVGCGKGYLTVALATLCRAVCGMDLMNGLGRRGWWTNFRAEMGALDLNQRVTGIRASATDIPFSDGSFSLTVSGHALRNFGGRSTIVDALSEMRRVTRSGGRVIVAENLPVAGSRAQEAHLKMYKFRIKYVRGDSPFFTESELVQMFHEAALPPTYKKILDFDLSAAPPMFVLNIDTIPEGERDQAVREYSAAVEMIREHGESSPPLLLIEAVVE